MTPNQREMQHVFNWLEFDNSRGKYFLKRSEDCRNNYALAIEKLNGSYELISDFMPPAEMKAYLKGIRDFVTIKRINLRNK